MKTISIEITTSFPGTWTIKVDAAGKVEAWREQVLMGRGVWKDGALSVDTAGFDDGNEHAGPEFERLLALIHAGQAIEEALANSEATSAALVQPTTRAVVSLARLHKTSFTCPECGAINRWTSHENDPVKGLKRACKGPATFEGRYRQTPRGRTKCDFEWWQADDEKYLKPSIVTRTRRYLDAQPQEGVLRLSVIADAIGATEDETCAAMTLIAEEGKS